LSSSRFDRVPVLRGIARNAGATLSVNLGPNHIAIGEYYERIERHGFTLERQPFNGNVERSRVITSFGDKQTEDFYNRGTSRVLARSLWQIARRKLDMINAAHELKDLKVPPGNRLEKLKGNLTGFWSIRINDQFRIIFRFASDNASGVKITDYH
jgi:proteic killer suppression protein